jgi:hypothetical protein
MFRHPLSTHDLRTTRPFDAAQVAELPNSNKATTQQDKLTILAVLWQTTNGEFA